MMTMGYNWIIHMFRYLYIFLALVEHLNMYVDLKERRTYTGGHTKLG